MADWGTGRYTLDDFFYIVRTTMPYGDAGTLSRQQYIDVIAYILQANGYPPGTDELEADREVLTQIIIQPQPMSN